MDSVEACPIHAGTDSSHPGSPSTSDEEFRGQAAGATWWDRGLAAAGRSALPLRLTGAFVGLVLLVSLQQFSGQQILRGRADAEASFTGLAAKTNVSLPPKKPENCPSESVAPSSDPEPQGVCAQYIKSDAHSCTKGCGNCFNPGARAGVMCKGQQLGYNCPSDPNPDGDVAFACMDWTFGSVAQRAAEKSYNCRSGKDPVYFGVGTYGTADDVMSGLGMCVLLDIDGLDRNIIAQSINTGFDVMGNQFDLQIGAGGAGAFNTCAGGPGSMYPGSTEAWGKQYGGLSYKANCSDLPRFPRDGKAMKAAGDDLVALCEYGFEKGVRLEGGENPSIKSIKRVACPAELVNLTQLQRSDEPTEEEEQQEGRRLTAKHKCGHTPGMGAAWCLTRMMDCRKPSGGFQDNVETDHVVKGHRLVQPCTDDGYTRVDVQCGCPNCWC